MDEEWRFKSMNMGRELEVAGEFVYQSAKKMKQLKRVHYIFDVNSVLYFGSVGIERLQKIYLCLTYSMEKLDSINCLKGHNHLELEKAIIESSNKRLPQNGRSLLGLYVDYYNNYRYGNYKPWKAQKDISELLASFLKKKNGKFDFSQPCTDADFEEFRKFYINELGKVAYHYYELIVKKAHDLYVYTYEIESDSNAARVFWNIDKRTLYGEIIHEEEAIKELLIFIYQHNGSTKLYNLLNEIKPLELDEGMINDYLSYICTGRISDYLSDEVDECYEMIVDKKELNNRKELLSLIGNQDVLFDWDEEDDDF